GDRIRRFYELYGWHANEAHNGYLETYLSLGLVGLFLMAGLFMATFWKSRREVFTNFQWGRFRISFFTVLLVYNWTEAGFKTLHPMWFMFFMIAVDYPRSFLSNADSSIHIASSESDVEFTYAESTTVQIQPGLGFNRYESGPLAGTSVALRFDVPVADELCRSAFRACSPACPCFQLDRCRRH